VDRGAREIRREGRKTRYVVTCRLLGFGCVSFREEGVFACRVNSLFGRIWTLEDVGFGVKG
jgi:hypothetical protein